MKVYGKLYELHAVKAGIWHFVLQIRKQLMKTYGSKMCAMLSQSFGLGAFLGPKITFEVIVKV